MPTPTTTASAVRNRIIAVISALIPATDATLRFLPYRNELGADFRGWATKNPSARRFQVRDDGTRPRPRVTNMDVEEKEVTFSIVVAYPQTNKWGANGALDRDTVMEQDEKQILHNIGRDARANFAAPTYPDACWRSSDTRREALNGVDFLVITQTMAYFGSTT